MAASKTKKKRADETLDCPDQNLLVKDAWIWTGRGFTKGSILIDQGKVERISRRFVGKLSETINASGLYALPGLVDVHVHLRDMRLSYKEDFASGTAAAAAGGFTSVLDMPNTLPPTDTPERLIMKQERAATKTYVNVGFHTAAVSDPKTIIRMAMAGAFSLKLYMPKPISPLNVSDDEELRRIMLTAARLTIPITIHAEDLTTSKQTRKAKDFQALASNRFASFESIAVERTLRAREGTECQVHYCHLTLPTSLERIRSSRGKVTSEVTPHHLLLSRRLLSKLGWRGWMVPPLRSEPTRRELLAATAAGLTDVVASDHAPHTLEEKARVPEESLAGVPGLETTLPLLLTLYDRGVIRMSHLVRLLAENPAKIFGLKDRGKLARGYAGDITLMDLKKRSRVDSSKFFSKARFSPFDGFETRGAVHSTIVKGKLVYHEGQIVAREGCGSILRSRPLA